MNLRRALAAASSVAAAGALAASILVSPASAAVEALVKQTGNHVLLGDQYGNFDDKPIEAIAAKHRSRARKRRELRNALRDAGAKVTEAFVIFHYGIFPQSIENMDKAGVRLHALCTWWDVLAEARAQGAFDEKTLTEVEAFLNDPRAWQAARAK